MVYTTYYNKVEEDIGGLADSQKVFYRYTNNETGARADHVDMIDGDDMKSIDFIIAIMEGDVANMADEEMASSYGCYRTEQS